jgi:SAM-dependent methyltransferase
MSEWKKTPLLPQWFAFHGEAAAPGEICDGLQGLVADIGCAESKPEGYLPPAAQHLGMDYYSTATDWYGTRPDLFADAQALPLKDRCADHALLLNALEHLPEPGACHTEIHRVLKPGGTLTLQVSFMCPVHDAPLDFQRWTCFGLINAARRHGFAVERETLLGHSLESADLAGNIALGKTVLNWVRHRHVLSLAVVLLPLAILLNNLLARGEARLSRPDPLMPHGYRMVWLKPQG